MNKGQILPFIARASANADVQTFVRSARFWLRSTQQGRKSFPMSSSTFFIRDFKIFDRFYKIPKNANSKQSQQFQKIKIK